MKRKGITIWEQYLEYIVLGVAVLFLIGFGAFQFLRAPNVVQDTKPSEIDAKLEAKANQLGNRLASGASSPVEIPPHQPFTEKFRSRLAEPVSPAVAIAPAQPAALAYAPGDDSSDVDPTDPFVVPTVPQPTLAMGSQHFDTLDAAVIEGNEALTARFATAPYDLTWITVGAQFDMDALRRAYREGADGAQPIPATWYRNGPHLPDVIVEREEMSSDGMQWTNRVTIDVLPGAYSVREVLAGDLDKTSRDDLLDEIATAPNQQEILQPTFYGLTTGLWTPPDPVAFAEEDAERNDDGELTDEEREIASLKRRIRKEERRVSTMMQQLDDAGGEFVEEREDDGGDDDGDEGAGRTGGTPPGSGRGAPGPGGGGGRGAPGPGGSATGLGVGGSEEGRGGRARDQRRIDTLNKQINKKLRAVRTMRERLEELTGEVMDEQQDDAMSLPLIDRDAVTLWAHDLTAEIGKVYRYRFTVVVANPFFGKKLSLNADQQTLADGVIMRSEPSDWSSPVRVQDWRRVFVTKAYVRPDERGNIRGQLGLGQVRAEVYRFYDSRWWMDSFLLEPGEQVGEETEQTSGVDEEGRTTKRAIDFGMSWFVLDILENLSVEDETAVEGGMAAYAVLQHMSDPEQVLRFDPANVADDPDRDALLDEVRSAEAGIELASTDG